MQYSPIWAAQADYYAGNPSIRLSVDVSRRLAHVRRCIDDLRNPAYTGKQSGRFRGSLAFLHDQERQFSDYETLCHSQLDTKQVITHDLRAYIRAELGKFGKTNGQFDEFIGRERPPARRLPADSMAALYVRKMREQAKAFRKTDLQTRIIDEARVAHSKGWFVVFNTLTVSDVDYVRVFRRGSTAWRYFIRNITRDVGYSLGMTAKQADERAHDLHRYFAVVEHGGKTARLHIHVLHFLRALPRGSTDPNANRRNPDYSQLDSMRPFWKFGFCVPVMVRYGRDDAFSRAGYRWRVRCVNGEMIPEKASNVEAIAGYVSKYVSKTYEQEIKQWKKTNPTTSAWRSRMTRGFGLQWIRNQLTAMPARRLLWAAQENKCRRITWPHYKSAPAWRRLRSEILRELSRRRIIARHFLTRPPPRVILKRGKLVIRTLSEVLACRPVRCGITRRRRVAAAICSIYAGLIFPGMCAIMPARVN